MRFIFRKEKEKRRKIRPRPSGKKVSVLLYTSVERFGVSRMRVFYFTKVLILATFFCP